MSKLMLVFGVLFLSLGLALGLLIHFSPGEMQVRGLTPDVSAILLVGGALCMGLGDLIGALRDSTVASAPAVAVTVTETASEKPATPKFTGFGKKAQTTAVVAEVPVAPVETAAAPAKGSVADTISALEKAKSDIAVALGVETHETAAEEPVVEKSAREAKEEPTEESDLFVVEEKVIRGRPARVLSDGTVEAETDEGWMRFENLDHLDEYLEAMVPGT
ncbi:MAG: hypothetical protein WCE69_09560 [Aestuariivirga sp.]